MTLRVFVGLCGSRSKGWVYLRESFTVAEASVQVISHSMTCLKLVMRGGRHLPR